MIQDSNTVATISIICNRINKYFETNLFKDVIQACDQDYVTENYKLEETQNAVGWFFHHLMQLFPDKFYPTRFFNKNEIRTKVKELISDQIITDVQEIWEFLLSAEGYILCDMSRKYTDTLNRMTDLFHELADVMNRRKNKLELYFKSKENLASNNCIIKITDGQIFLEMTEIENLKSVENELNKSIAQLKQTTDQQKQDIDLFENICI